MIEHEAPTRSKPRASATTVPHSGHRSRAARAASGAGSMSGALTSWPAHAQVSATRPVPRRTSAHSHPNQPGQLAAASLRMAPQARRGPTQQSSPVPLNITTASGRFRAAQGRRFLHLQQHRSAISNRQTTTSSTKLPRLHDVQHTQSPRLLHPQHHSHGVQARVVHKQTATTSSHSASQALGHVAPVRMREWSTPSPGGSLTSSSASMRRTSFAPPSSSTARSTSPAPTTTVSAPPNAAPRPRGQHDDGRQATRVGRAPPRRARSGRC